MQTPELLACQLAPARAARLAWARRPRLPLDAALEAAEDGHVAGLKVRRALWREEAQHDVRESGPHGGRVASLAWTLAMSQRMIHDCPSLLGFSMLSRVAASFKIVAVVADSVLLHEPAQLDEQSMRVGVLMFRAVELCQALGGLLVAHAHATQEFLYFDVAGTHVESLCVEPLEHQAVNRDYAQAQDVGHPQTQTLDLAQAPLHVPWSFYPSPAPHVEEPVAGDGVDAASRV